MAATESGAAMASYCVDFVDKDNAGGILFALNKEIANTARTNTDKHFNKIGTGNGKERNSRLTGDGTCKQGFAGSRRAHQQYTFRQSAAKLGEFFRVLQEGNDLLKLFLGLIHTSHILEGYFPLGLGQKFCPALAEGHCLAAARLHLAHEENPDGNQENQGKPGQKHREPGNLVFRRFCRHGYLLIQQLLGQRRIFGLIGLEFLAAGILADNLVTTQGDGGYLPCIKSSDEFGIVRLILCLFGIC